MKHFNVGQMVVCLTAYNEEDGSYETMPKHMVDRNGAKMTAFLIVGTGSASKTMLELLTDRGHLWFFPNDDTHETVFE